MENLHIYLININYFGFYWCPGGTGLGYNLVGLEIVLLIV